MSTTEPGYWVYIVECADGSYYTGATHNLKRRIDRHNRGLGGKYTHSHGPVKLLYYETLPTWSAALKREYEIKQLTRTEKTGIIERFFENSGANPPF